MSDCIARADRMLRYGWGFLVGVMVMGIGCGAMAASPSGEKSVQTRTGVNEIGQEIKNLEQEIRKPPVTSKPVKPMIKLEEDKTRTNQVES